MNDNTFKARVVEERDQLQTIYQESSLSELNPHIDKILEGDITGRTVVNLESEAIK